MSERSDELRRQLVRNVHDVKLERQTREPLYDTRCGGVSDGTVATKLGAGYDELPAGKRSCPYHFHHAQEEMFVILEGEGSLRVAGEVLPLRAGDTVFIPAGPDYPHQIINTSAAPLKYLSISTRERPEVCEYPDSGKYLAMAGSADRPFSAMHRAKDDLDYWDGEP